jgi:hypothetical protein
MKETQRCQAGLNEQELPVSSARASPRPKRGQPGRTGRRVVVLSDRARSSELQRVRRAKHPEIERAWRAAHREHLRAYHRRWSASHPKQVRAARDRYRLKHPEQADRASRYYFAHREERLKYFRAYVTRRSKVDVVYKLTLRLHSRIWKALKGKKRRRVADLLGCSVEKFKQLMERKFRPGMTWKNHGHVWHLDHIRPIASFDLSDPIQQRRCFNYRNYQPLFRMENLKKSSRWRGRLVRRS